MTLISFSLAPFAVCTPLSSLILHRLITPSPKNKTPLSWHITVRTTPSALYLPYILLFPLISSGSSNPDRTTMFSLTGFHCADDFQLRRHVNPVPSQSLQQQSLDFSASSGIKLHQLLERRWQLLLTPLQPWNMLVLATAVAHLNSVHPTSQLNLKVASLLFRNQSSQLIRMNFFPRSWTSC